nr:Clp protease N-terminal domain-containing protein [Kitasatospora sp. MAA4]
MGQRAIRPGHLVLGLIGENEGMAVQVMRDHGLDPAAVRAAVLPTLG